MLTANPKCETCTNLNCLIRKHVNHTLIEQFLKKKFTIKCKKGQCFVIEGLPIQDVYFVYQGSMKVTTTNEQNESRLIGFVGQGEIIGRVGLDEEPYYLIGTTALEESLLCGFSLEVFSEMLMQIPALMKELIGFYSKELKKSQIYSTQVTKQSTKNRIIQVLIDISHKFGQESEILNVSLTRKELAQLAGTSEDKVIRVLSDLKREGLIHTKGKKIGVLNLYQLQESLNTEK